MDAHRAELAHLIALEEGKPLKDARAEVQRSINITEFMAGEGRRFGGYTSGSESAMKFAFTTRQPLGMVAAITPWNFPLAIPAWKVAPALVAGNAVILKPASATPGTAVRLAEIYREAGLPDGILNVLVARGGQAGQTLLDAPEVVAVSITGSTGTGRTRCRPPGGARRPRPGRAGRQECRDRARRRGPGPGHGGYRRRRLRLDWPALHGDQPRDRGRRDRRCPARTRARAHPRTAGWRRHAGRHRRRSGRLCRPAAAGRALPRHRPDRGCRAGLRRGPGTGSMAATGCRRPSSIECIRLCGSLARKSSGRCSR